MSGCVADYCINSAKKSFEICRFYKIQNDQKFVLKVPNDKMASSNNSVLCEVSKNLLL